MKFEFTGALLLATLASQANAFWGTPHLLVSRIAEFILKDEAPNSLAAAISELQTLKDSDPSITTSEDSHPFTECGTFADDIKGQGYSFQADWHFIDQPLMIDGGDINDYTLEESDVNVYNALALLTLWLQGTGDYANSTYYKQIYDQFNNEEEARSFALRMIIHYVADIHQPLHAVVGISEDYPSGDHGGNYEHLPSLCTASNLHAVWDSVLYDYCDRPDLPLDTDDWSWYSNEAATIKYAYPQADSDIRSGQFHMWAAESFDMAVEFAYPGVESGQALSDEYIDAAEPMVKNAMALAGRRLANLIMQIYPNESSSAFLQ